MLTKSTWVAIGYLASRQGLEEHDRDRDAVLTFEEFVDGSKWYPEMAKVYIPLLRCVLISEF